MRTRRPAAGGQPLSSRPTDADLRRTNAAGWTVSAILAHIAFWDRITVARWERHQRDGSWPDTDVDLVNAAAIHQWRVLAPREAAAEVAAAAETIDALVVASSQRAPGRDRAGAHGAEDTDIGPRHG